MCVNSNKNARIRNRMNIAYCEDEKIQLEYMEQLIKKWADEGNDTVTYFGYGSAKELLFEHPDSFPFDLLLLDIDMDGMDGMALAKEIRKKDQKLPIVFLTNRSEYVFEGYEVGALRYLLKPVEETKLFSLLDEISYALGKERRYLIENVDGETVKISVDTIYSVEAKGHYIRLHTSAGDYEYKKNLSEITEELAKDQPGQKTEFISTHRSFLVSLAAVERVQRTECILCDGSSVPVSRNAYKSVNEAFIRYYMEHGDMCEK